MVGWGIPLFQLISTLVGSGLTLFVLNNLAADLNQPQIDLDIVTNHTIKNVNPQVRSSDAIYKNNNFTRFENEIITINNGRSPATNLLLHISYPNGNVTAFNSTVQTENVTLSKMSSNLLMAQTDRLARDSLISISTVVECNLNTNNNQNRSLKGQFNPSLKINMTCPPMKYFISVSYDQGSIYQTNMESEIINTDRLYSFRVRDQLLTIAITVAMLSFTLAIFHKRIKNFRKRLSKPKFVFEIVREIITIRDTLHTNIQSKKIFPIEIWYSKTIEDKLRIFNDYDDYNYIDDFYSMLKERDELMSRKDKTRKVQKQGKDEETENVKDNDNDPTYKKTDGINNVNQRIDVTHLNRRCLLLASNIIGNINWSNYQDTEDKKYYIPIAVFATIITAFSISFAFEFYRFVLFQQSLSVPDIQYRLVFLFFTIIVKSLLFFAVAKEIINFQTLFAYEVGNKNDILSFFILDRNAQLKLLLFSFVIAGVPFLSIMTDFQFLFDEMHFLAVDPSLGYLFLLIQIITDVVRFMVLVLIIPRFIIKPKKVIVR